MSPQETSSQDHHVAVFPFPFCSHPISLLNLLLKLALTSSNVQFSFLTTPTSMTSLLKLTSEVVLNLPDNVKPYGVVGDGVPPGHAPSEDPTEATELFLKASRANFKYAIEFVVAKTGTKITFLLVDALLSVFVADLAEELNVRWVPVWAASPCALLAYVHAGLICEHWAADH
ncbi:hypothetical protein L484_014781 [Morus notabilis]|uniref:Uncharacterized protein n=1 Tax=Morus notabilis TaxID=981085 RepID=W9SAB2_9ROSA|nr:hypothetical protein L484_014781 [Morus notabilis]